jgi:hypothetical protein
LTKLVQRSKVVNALQPRSPMVIPDRHKTPIPA